MWWKSNQRPVDTECCSLCVEKVGIRFKGNEFKFHNTYFIVRQIEQIVAFIGHESIENVNYLEPYGIERAEYIYFQP